MNLAEVLNHFYYRMALNELRVMNRGDYFRGLSYHSVLYLNVIALEQPCTPGRIAAILRVSKAAATMKLAELEKQGFIVKRRSPLDRRTTLIELTGPTREALALYDRVFARIEAGLGEKYGAAELRLFAEMTAAIGSFDWETPEGSAGEPDSLPREPE